MTALKMYTDDNDWVIATSPEDATAIILELSGITDDEREGWRELPMDKIFDFKGAAECPPGRKTIAEWIAQEGRGMFATVNW